LLAFAAAGGMWFYEQGWLSWAGVAFVVGEAVALLLFRLWAQAEQPLLPQPSTRPPESFSPRDEEAWQLVLAYQEQIERGELVFTSLDEYIGLGREMLERMAKFYRPDDPDPLIAVPVPLLFRALEETAHDLATVTTNLPFAHRVTIGEILRGYRIGQKLKPAYELYQVYRILSPLLNWQSAIIRFFVTERLFDLTKETLQQWLLRWYVDRVGYHAIGLYSGKLLLDQRPDSSALQTRKPSEWPSGRPSGRPSETPDKSYDTMHANTQDTTDTTRHNTQAMSQTVSSEPLRVLILGQVKAGKSSVLNALFGEVRASVDVVPTTLHLTPYVLDRIEGEAAVLLYDMGGYDDPTMPKDRLADVLSEALQADLILLVSSAVNAAREPDRRVLQYVRDYFSAHPELHPPPILIALTHIDRLRPPLVWEPPYNIVSPHTPKAHSIRGALDAVGNDLKDCGLPSAHIIPVCVHPERLYNIEEALMPALVHSLPDAKRTLLVWSLKTKREQEQWTLLGRQAQTAGLFLLEIGGEVLQKVIRTVVYETRAGRTGKREERG
jgi:hypothetical protein